MLDLQHECAWIGGDSLGSNGFTKQTQAQSKVFRNDVFNNVVMGSTGSFRHIDLLRYSSLLFNGVDFYTGANLDHKYMVTKFIPNLIKLFDENIKHMKPEDKGTNFIVCAKNKVFEVQTDYSVLEPLEGYTAVGSGEYAALASMYSTKDLDISIPDKIRIALESAEHCVCSVQRPFYIMSTNPEEKTRIIS